MVVTGCHMHCSIGAIQAAQLLHNVLDPVTSDHKNYALVIFILEAE